MELLPKELRDKFPSIEEARSNEDPMIVAKYFHPMSSNWTWYAAGYSDGIFWGLVDGHYVEIGIFLLEEMQEVEVLGLGIERDLYFEPTRMSKIKRNLKR